MSGTFWGIETGKRALQANKLAMNVTQQNVANAGTSGYTRQEAVFSTTADLKFYGRYREGSGYLGTGVEISEVRRLRDAYLDKQAMQNKSEIGYWETASNALGRVEAVFPEVDNNGLQKLFGKFFQAWSDLSQEPDSTALRANVKETAGALAEGFRLAYAQLKGTGDDLEDSLGNPQTGMVRQINDLAGQVNDLNADIAKAVQAGAVPSQLMDRRDQLLEKLSYLFKVDVTYEPDGTVTVKAGGKTLVDGPGLSAGALSVNGSGNIELAEPGQPAGAEITAPGGAVGALLDTRARVGEYLANLNELAGTLVQRVNDLNGLDNEGKLIFKAGAEPAADIDLSDDLGTSLAAVNGYQSLAVANLREELTMSGGTETFEGYYQGRLIGGIALAAGTAGDKLDARNAVQEQLESLRQSLSGVSVDEELAKMVQYQYAYQASAKMISALDDMLAILMDMIR